MRQLDNLGQEDFKPLGAPIPTSHATFGKREDIAPGVQECLDGPHKGKWVTNVQPVMPAAPAPTKAKP
jgi:hypothetical protein